MRLFEIRLPNRRHILSAANYLGRIVVFYGPACRSFTLIRDVHFGTDRAVSS